MCEYVCDNTNGIQKLVNHNSKHELIRATSECDNNTFTRKYAQLT